MAASKSLTSAQNIIPCQLCETVTKLQWKCLDCDLLMCNYCYEKIHPKFKSAKDHRVKDIKEIGLAEVSHGEELNFTNIKCKKHSPQNCCIYCTACEELCCPSCLAKGHSGHKFIEIKDSYDMKVKTLQTGMQTEQREAGVDQMEIRESQTFNQVLKDIDTQRDAMNKTVDMYAENLKAEAKKHMDAINNYVSIERKQIEEVKKMSTVKQLLVTRNVMEFFDKVDRELQGMKNCLSDNPKPTPMPNFAPAVFNKEVFGSFVSSICALRKPTQINLKVKNTFLTELRACHLLFVSSDGAVWIVQSGNGKHIITKSKPKEHVHVLETIFSKDITVYDLEPLPNGDLLMADRTSTLKIINQTTGEVRNSEYRAKLLFLTVVHITTDQRVIVGARSTKEAFPVQGRRVVLVFDLDGIINTEWEYDDKGDRIFSLPKLIEQAKNNNIFVIDYLAANFKGRILVLGQSGQVIQKYTGHPAINDEEAEFKPRAIKTTPSDNIIISDRDNHLIHLLDNTGNFLSYFNARSIFPEDPYSLFFCDRKTIYIGCLGDSKANAKIYKVEYSES